MARALGVVLVLACAAGCAPVRAWERGTLARPSMAAEPDPERAAFEEHIAAAREAALSPAAAGGGGCGCN
jgi:hypothetical protein